MLERTGYPAIPRSIRLYLSCCPNLDFNLRMLPSNGGYYDQRYRDFLEFGIIEQRIRDIRRRHG